MTDVTLGVPLGPFFWRAGFPGDICYCTVQWDCQYTSPEAIAIPPTIYQVGNDIVVTNRVADCENRLEYVSPGVLTMTPTVTCPSYDPNNPDPVVTVLDPVYLTISEGACYGAVACPFPANRGFESGDASGWTNVKGQIETGTVYAGTYAWRSVSDGFTLDQTYYVQNLTVPTQVNWTCKATSVSGPGRYINLELRWFDDVGALIDLVTYDLLLTDGSWSTPAVVATIPTNAKTILCYAWSAQEHVVVDSFELTPCP